MEAGLLSIEASLSIDLGEFEKALAQVRRAIEIYRDLEDWTAVAHNSVLEAGCYLAACRPQEAVAAARFAIERLAPHEIRLQALAKLIQVDGLVSQERPLEALPHFMEARELCDQAELGMRLRAIYCEARLLSALGCGRESEKLFRHTIRAYLDQDLYKEAFITLLTLFECFCQRGALSKAAALCEEAIAATSQAGEACNDQIRRTWEELLATVRLRQLSVSELVQARQFLVRHWSNPAGAEFALSRVAAPQAEPQGIAVLSSSALAGPSTFPTSEPESFEDFHSARDALERQLIAAALEKSGGNLSGASRTLRISRNTLKARIREYGLHGTEAVRLAAHPNSPARAEGEGGGSPDEGQ